MPARNVAREWNGASTPVWNVAAARVAVGRTIAVRLKKGR